jgi:hypothetical protein
MWLNLIKQKFNKNKYKNSIQFFEDIKLIWSNCMKFNQENSLIFETAQKMDKDTDRLIQEYNLHITQKTDKKLLGAKRKLIDSISSPEKKLRTDQIIETEKKQKIEEVVTEAKVENEW